MLYLAANWKSNQTITQAKLWLETFRQICPGIPSDYKLILCAPFTDLSQANQYIDSYNIPISMGAQNVSVFEGGSHTGQISSLMLSELVSYCLLGHSEVRLQQSETNETVAAKAQELISSKITPIICLDKPYLENQIKALFKVGVDIKACIFAYEPISAIGSSHPQNSSMVEQVASQISFLTHFNCPILYGGSVTGKNIKVYVSKPHVNGVLVGGASLSAQSFVSLISSLVIK